MDIEIILLRISMLSSNPKLLNTKYALAALSTLQLRNSPPNFREIPEEGGCGLHKSLSELYTGTYAFSGGHS